MAVPSDAGDAMTPTERVIAAARRVNQLDCDPHPGLSTWNEARDAAHAALRDALRAYDAAQAVYGPRPASLAEHDRLAEALQKRFGERPESRNPQDRLDNHWRIIKGEQERLDALAATVATLRADHDAVAQHGARLAERVWRLERALRLALVGPINAVDGLDATRALNILDGRDPEGRTDG